jgi:hypothetical protein
MCPWQLVVSKRGSLSLATCLHTNVRCAACAVTSPPPQPPLVTGCWSPASARFKSSVFLSENAKPGDSVGPAISAVDPDVGDRITFTMASGNSSLFRVVELAPKVAGIQVATQGLPNARFADVSFDLVHSVSSSGSAHCSESHQPSLASFITPISS